MKIMPRKRFDLIIQGPIDLGALVTMTQRAKKVGVNKVIYSACSDDAYNAAMSVSGVEVLMHVDPGPNETQGGRSLNVNRYLAGIKSSLGEVVSQNVLIMRSDILFDLNFFLQSCSTKKDVLNCLDVTTKRWWAKPRWENHFCDWAYFMESNVALKVFVDMNYNDSEVDWSAHGGAFKISPESLIADKFFQEVGSKSEDRLNSTNIIFTKDIKLVSCKDEYKKIPFGINRAFGVRKFDLYFLKIFGYFPYGAISSALSSLLNRMYSFLK